MGKRKGTFRYFRNAKIERLKKQSIENYTRKLFVVLSVRLYNVME
jgi:hypothetical protein